MRHALLFAMVATLVVAAPVAAWDVAEPPRALLLVAQADRSYAHLAYTPQLIVAGPLDEFQLRSYGHFAPLELAGVAISAHVGTILFAGPPNFGIVPGAGAAQWLLNAVQFEYGLMAQTVVARLNGDLVALVEYSRRSYHPIVTNLAEPAADHIRVGVGVYGAAFGPFTLAAAMRLGYNELFEAWDAPRLPATRAPWVGYFAGEAELPLTATRSGRVVSAFAMVAADLLLLRAGGVDIDLDMELGLSVGGGGRAGLDLYLNLFRSGDTEQLRDTVSPAFLIGIGVRAETD